MDTIQDQISMQQRYSSLSPIELAEKQNKKQSMGHLNHHQKRIDNNKDRGERFRQDQKEVHLNRFKKDIIKKAKQGMTDQEWEELHKEPQFIVHDKSYKFADKSYFFFDKNNKLRQSMVWLMEWKYFDILITFTIMLNTIILIIQDYSFRIYPDQEKNWRHALIQYSEIVFTVVFVFEFFVKSFAMGFVLEKNTYLRDGWNFIDFIVVITSIISYFPGALSLSVSSIRTTRILRPLRSINYVEGLRILIASIIESLEELFNVLIFLTFIVTLFGILSLQLFGGAFENRCRLTERPENGQWIADSNLLYLCNLNDKNSCPPEQQFKLQ